MLLRLRMLRRICGLLQHVWQCLLLRSAGRRVRQLRRGSKYRFNFAEVTVLVGVRRKAVREWGGDGILELFQTLREVLEIVLEIFLTNWCFPMGGISPTRLNVVANE